MIYNSLGDVGVPAPSYALTDRPEEQFAALHAAATSAAERLAKRNDTQNDAFVRSICLYIQANLHDPDLSVDSIATAMNISRSFLYKKLKDTQFNSIARYITDQRMELACQLLRDTDLSIGEIAERCGYALLGTFTRVFKKTCGMQPLAYRRQSSS